MKKKVNVFCMRPFAIGHSSFAGRCFHIILDTKGILTCLENKAKVTEILADGRRVLLDFGNFDADNGPTGIDQKNAVTEDDVMAQQEPIIETITEEKARRHEEEVIEATAETNENNATPYRIEQIKPEVKKPEANPVVEETPAPKDEKKDDSNKNQDSSKNNNNKKK